jgi:Fic family protein
LGKKPQLEAQAHVDVHRWIDEGGLTGRAFTQNGIEELHRNFCEKLPGSLLWISNPYTNERVKVTPGQLRTQDVKVGNHVAVSPGSIPRFLKRFQTAYSTLGKTDRVICSATAHHRLLWIHPFLEGNGRVARLMSYAVLLETLETGGLWSISRGLARNESIYKKHLSACDQPRRGDLDGRGNLSEEALADFVSFFLNICIDQVDFMETLMQPTSLQGRITRWAKEETQADRLSPHSHTILEAVLYRGELSRSEASTLLGVSDRQARRVTSALIQRGVLSSESSRSPFFLAFPASIAHVWMPGLFPEK